MKTLIKILLLTSFFLLILFSCKKDQLEIKKTADPCECASEVSADFEIWERAFNSSLALETKTDHVLSGKRVDFRAVEDDAEYTWYIGADVESDKEVYKTFDSQWTNQTISITLVVNKEPNKICFPNDDGYDSITKTFNIYDRCTTHLLDGEFKVAMENSTDSIIMGLYYVENAYPPEMGCRYYEIVNYDGNGSTCSASYHYVERNYRGLRTLNATPFDNCKNVTIDFAEINLENEFILKLRYHDDISEPLISKSYFGRKLP